MGTPVSLSRLNGRLRSPNPAAMFTARLQAAMMRLATMITSVMSWIIVRRRAVDGSSDSTADRRSLEGKRPFERGPCPFERARRPVGGDDDRVDGKTAPLFAADRCADGQTVDDACELCPRRFERK